MIRTGYCFPQQYGRSCSRSKRERNDASSHFKIILACLLLGAPDGSFCSLLMLVGSCPSLWKTLEHVSRQISMHLFLQYGYCNAVHSHARRRILFAFELFRSEAYRWALTTLMLSIVRLNLALKKAVVEHLFLWTQPYPFQNRTALVFPNPLHVCGGRATMQAPTVLIFRGSLQSSTTGCRC